jgi:hypothetical protein
MHPEKKNRTVGLFFYKLNIGFICRYIEKSVLTGYNNMMVLLLSLCANIILFVMILICKYNKIRLVVN